LCTLLNTMKMFDREYGVMLSAEPCTQLASKNIADPAGPVRHSMPWRLANVVRPSWPGMPISCSRSEERSCSSGVVPTQGTNVRYDPGVIIRRPL